MNNQTSNKQKHLGKKISQILKDTQDENLITSTAKERSIDNLKEFSLKKKNYNKLIDCTKKEVINNLGLEYNDIHSNRWMYHITNKVSLFQKNYLYIYFYKNKVIQTKLRRFKLS